jgi:hypothetical protein
VFGVRTYHSPCTPAPAHPDTRRGLAAGANQHTHRPLWRVGGPRFRPVPARSSTGSFPATRPTPPGRGRRGHAADASGLKPLRPCRPEHVRIRTYLRQAQHRLSAARAGLTSDVEQRAATYGSRARRARARAGESMSLVTASRSSDDLALLLQPDGFEGFGAPSRVVGPDDPSIAHSPDRWDSLSVRRHLNPRHRVAAAGRLTPHRRYSVPPVGSRERAHSTESQPFVATIVCRIARLKIGGSAD